MWNRFNYFVVIQAALVALTGNYFKGGEKSTAGGLWAIALAGATLSLVWYLFGAQDRWLVTLYRTQAEEAAKKAAAIVQMPDYQWPSVSGYEFRTGSTLASDPVDEVSSEKWRGPREWTHSWLSITKLASIFPAFTFVIWSVSLFVLVPQEWPQWAPPKGPQWAVAGWVGILLVIALVSIALWIYRRHKRQRNDREETLST